MHLLWRPFPQQDQPESTHSHIPRWVKSQSMTNCCASFGSSCSLGHKHWPDCSMFAFFWTEESRTHGNIALPSWSTRKAITMILPIGGLSLQVTIYKIYVATLACCLAVYCIEGYILCDTHRQKHYNCCRQLPLHKGESKFLGNTTKKCTSS